MSLFRELRRLCLSDKEQIEDILTEIVAAVLENSEEITKTWLDRVGVADAAGSRVVAITTQYRLAGMTQHETDSRIDLVIRLDTVNGPHVVFVESKVDSKQGEAQLQRYAELLAWECREQKAVGSLVFITRDFEQVEKPTVPGFSFQFCLARWFHFYDILRTRSNSDGLEKQLKLLMKENSMSLGNQFRSTDLVALESFHSAKALMDESLTEISERWRGLLGKGGRLHKTMGQLRLHGRYMIATKFTGFEALLGYWLPEGNADESVSLGIVLYCDPKATERAAIVRAFREWAEERDKSWQTENLDDPRAWAGLMSWKWLRALQTSDDHLAEVKTYFSTLVDELEDFKAKFPDLPWLPTDSSDEEA